MEKIVLMEQQNIESFSDFLLVNQMQIIDTSSLKMVNAGHSRRTNEKASNPFQQADVFFA